MTEQEFDKAYWASKPPQLRQVVSATDAVNLATQGHIIDLCIQVWGWGPYKTMWLRNQQGYTWVPSLLQDPTEVPPGISYPGDRKIYDPLHPPAGSIKVSLDLTDYPPFDPPPPPKPAEVKDDPVMKEHFPGAGTYGVASWFVGSDGQEVRNDRGVFKLVVVANPFGVSRIFRKVG